MAEINMITNEKLIIGVSVIILNLIPLLTKRYKYLIVTIIISLILMYLGIYF